MGRRSKIWFSKKRGGYFTWYKHKREPLYKCKADDEPDGPNYLKAMDAFKELMQRDKTYSPDDTSVAAIFAPWMASLERNNPETAKATRSILRRFLDHWGLKNFDHLLPVVVERWIDAQDTWNCSTKLRVWRLVRGGLLRAYQGKQIYFDPFARSKPPRHYRMLARGSEFVLADGLADLLLSHAKGEWHDLLLALRRTGARPIELMRAERFNYDRVNKTIIFRADATRGYVHKTARSKKHGERDRKIRLDDQVADIVARNASKGTVLFPTRQGTAFYSGLMTIRWKTLRRQQDVQTWLHEHDHLPKYVIPYSFRHTWITNAIKRGVHIKVVADLTGTSVEMIEKNYCHAASDEAFMRDAFLKAIDKPASPEG